MKSYLIHIRTGQSPNYVSGMGSRVVFPTDVVKSVQNCFV